ncbi:hypothetical protein P5673_013344 [Acropora cervicornis]|uniref:Uncharacterized protein n=1 Tax=Acropora cervicornis TaxID=6130 RepID=A0AAD9QLN2_ACRCE|nr:hypothetical protein P5673_013344 [Acropora cervicornis]
MSLVTAGSARSAGVASSEQVQATILVNNGNIQIGPKVKETAMFPDNALHQDKSIGTGSSPLYERGTRELYEDASYYFGL